MIHKCSVKRITISAYIFGAVFGAAVLVNSKAQGQTPVPQEGSLAIWWMYEKLGREKGPLGKGESDSGGRAYIKPTQGKPGAYWAFQNGMITWSPHAGRSCVLAAYWNPDKKNPNSIIVRWGPTDPFDYDLFIVRMESPGVKARQSDVMTRNSKLATRSSGAVLLPNADRGRVWTILVEGAQRSSTVFGGTSTRAPQGWMHPVTVGGPPRVAQAAPPPVTPTSIAVTAKLKSPPVSTFTVTGSGFTPNKPVTILVTNDEAYQVNFQTQSTSAGKITASLEIPHQPRWSLNFVALDTRKNPSFPVRVTCPDYDAGKLAGKSLGVKPVQANPSGVKIVNPSAQIKNAYLLQLRSELAVARFAGVIQGNNYVLSGTVKHPGKSRMPAGGDVQIFAVNAKGKAKLVKTITVPKLEFNKAWTLPQVTVPRASSGAGSTGQFILVVGNASAKSKNVWKPLRVTRSVPSVSQPVRKAPLGPVAPVIQGAKQYRPLAINPVPQKPK